MVPSHIESFEQKDSENTEVQEGPSTLSLPFCLEVGGMALVGSAFHSGRKRSPSLQDGGTLREESDHTDLAKFPPICFS